MLCFSSNASDVASNAIAQLAMFARTSSVLGVKSAAIFAATWVIMDWSLLMVLMIHLLGVVGLLPCFLT